MPGKKKLGAKKAEGRVSTKKERFLRAYAKIGIVTVAARQARVCTTQHYKWLKSDAEYPARFAAAREAAVQSLEETLVREAKAGNTAALIFALKAARPEVYRDNYQRVELSGPNGGPIESRVEGRRIEQLTDAELEAIILEHRAEHPADAEPELLAVESGDDLGLPESNGHGRLRLAGPDADEAAQ